MNAIAIAVLFQLATSSAGSMSYPVLGYTLTGGRLTRLTGVPGASSAAVEPGEAQYLRLQSAPATRAVLLSLAGDSPALIYRTPLSDTAYRLQNTPTAIALSPAGIHFAALTSSGVTLYRRTSTTPLTTISANSLPLPVPEISGIVVGDSGQVVLQAIAGFWYSDHPATPSSFTFVPTVLTSLRIAPRDQLLIGYEAGQGRLIALHPRASFAVEPLLSAPDLASAVTGLEFSAEGHSIWISQAVGPLFTYDLLRRQAAAYSLPPGSIAAVTAPGVYLWEQPDQQLAVLDTTQAGDPRVLIVPAAVDGAGK